MLIDQRCARPEPPLNAHESALSYPGSNQVTYGYDSADRMQTLTDWLSNTTNFDYDADGNLLAQIYPNNTRADLSFDAAGGLSALAHTSGGSAILSLSYTRDALGLLSLANEGSLGSHSYSYDALNRLLGEQLNGTSAISSTWSYDAATNIQRTSATPGQPISAWSSLSGATASGNTLQKTGGVAYQWDAGGVSTEQVSSGDVAAQATADNVEHYTQFGLGNSNTTASGDDIDYSIRLAEGNVQVFELGTQRGGNWTTYVHGDVLTVAVVQAVVRYYKNGSLFYTSQVTPSYPLRFDSSLADPNSRILSAQFGTGVVTTVSSTRSYNDAGQLLSLVEALGAHNKRNLAFTYNLTGNRTQQVDSAIGLTTTYGYDQANRLINYNGGAATYAYNGDGLRMSKTKSGSTEQFVWDIGAGLPLLLKDGTASYIYGPGGLLAQIRADNTVYYYHADQLGSVRALTNSSGAVVATYQYDAYGSVISKTGTITNPFGYAGEYTDGESGLIYLRARYYDPATQQFISRDPIHMITEEPYGYVYGDPINSVDPSGLARASETTSGSSFPSVQPSWFCWVFNLCSAQESVAKSYISYYSTFHTSILLYRFKGREIAYAIGDGLCVPFMPGTDEIFGGAALMGGTVMSGGMSGAPLRFIHSTETLEQTSSYRFWSNKSSEQIIESLQGRGGHPPAEIKPNGAIMDGNTRLHILRQRGVDIDSLNLPRTFGSP